ncbi:GNAT family N-acetyltransferase [Subtercola endophyticus]|uniref:GNAT family N-acetyltransferase n=1 Tax=Subtercola endophyticus TaxID=2895559 RepID=UPI001E3AB247|nr:GNAT family N-acetyltransferase [Subtercola endophyticus]UFS58179.1 GNAT family N-acetyltransferase [Subtercola endophyticus]
MSLQTAHVALEPISPSLARRIVVRDERQGDNWHPEYPFADELDPLRSLGAMTDPDPYFTMYVIRRISDHRAVGGFSFFGPPDTTGRVEFGYGLVPSARGGGLATDAVTLALNSARAHGAAVAAADTDQDNRASQRVLLKSGLIEVARRDSLIFYERDLTA